VPAAKYLFLFFVFFIWVLHLLDFSLQLSNANAHTVVCVYRPYLFMCRELRERGIVYAAGSIYINRERGRGLGMIMVSV
jgi:hypothetical protein